MKMRTARLAALSLLPWLACFSTAWAATTTDTFSVTATVTATCTVTADDLSFGNYAGNQLDAESHITATCTNTTAYHIALSDGANPDGTQRRMANGTNYLEYELYSDSGRSSRWGGDPDWVAGTGDGNPQEYHVYGRIPANQNPPALLYTDTITVTLSY